MQISLIQQDVAVADKNTNFKTVTRLVEEAVSMSPAPDLIVLPELWSTGYALEDLVHLASEEGEEEAHFLGELAFKHKVWFAGGSVAAKTKEGITNRAQIIDRNGNLKQTYDKIHLVPMLREDKFLTAGNKICLYQIEGITFGFAICYDIRFGQFMHKLALEGAEALIVSAQWPLVRLNHWQTLLQARAIENQYYVLAANNSSKGEPDFAGHSAAYGPDGSIICQLEREQSVAQLMIEPAIVQKVRQEIPVFSDRRPELYQ
ncbi:MAG: omega-amidase [Desulforhopalus sp.]|jgi:omega-amidase